ncbi:Mg2+ transporter protein CorA-like/Zinc transport protein ZntB [Penicillium sp. IBT 18751x]|nr:Mg2+ transporter protein CorA-like/Zinc transport protein ZntB [Penicillium sp. IBT 18751x]
MGQTVTNQSLLPLWNRYTVVGVMCVPVHGHSVDVVSRRQSRPRTEQLYNTTIGMNTYHSLKNVHATFAYMLREIALTRNLRMIPDMSRSTDASDDEHIRVHHVVKIRPSYSIYDRDNERNPKLRSRVFTNQPSFKHEENLPPETYRIIHTRLVPREDEHTHDIAVLTYDEGATRTETEISWIHLQSNFLSLELLEIESLRLDNISEVTCTLIRSAFRHLRQQNEKSYVNGRYLDPTALSFVARDDENRETKECSVAFFALPYFALEPLRRQEPPSQVSMHPVRSLLQFHYSFHPTGRRDEKQVVCSVLESPEVIHVPQTWMLLINGDLILSMGPSNLETLRGEVVTLEKMTQPDSGPVVLQVRIIDLEGKEYCLPKPRCQTWFELITMFVGALEEENFMLPAFLNDSWRDEYELRVDNKLVSEENWSEILRERDGNDVTIYISMKPHKVVRDYHSRPGILVYDDNSIYDAPNRHHGHGYSTRAEKQLVHSIGNPMRTKDMIRHPAFMGQRSKDDDASIRQHHADAIQKNAWKSDKKPIRLKDLAGFELMIPWRVGRTWRKMEPVIGTKMQYDPEHLSAFRAGAYALNGPDGPISPADWNDKIYPGCVVELRLKGFKESLKLVSPRRASRGPRSRSPLRASSDAADRPFTPAPLRRINTDHQIELPGFAAPRNSADLDSRQTSEEHDEAGIIQCPNRTTTEHITTSGETSPFCRQSPASRSLDNHLLSFDTFLEPSGHDTEPNPAEENDQHPDIYQKPVRRATDLQSFVEDVNESSSTEKGSLGSMTAIVSPVEDSGLGPRETADKQSLSSSLGPDQPTQESRNHRKVRRRASSSRSLSISKGRSSTDADANIENPYPERDQVAIDSPRPMEKGNDSIDMASLNQMNDSYEETPVAQPSSETGMSPLCPIFAWKLEATDGLPSTPSEKSEPLSNQHRDMDRTIRAILEERDAEANIYFLRHRRESDLIGSLSECSRIEVLRRMKMICHAQKRGSDAQYSVKKMPEWEKMQNIITEAIEILDAFVPVHYQNLHQYWLIKKFYGALLTLLTKEYSGAYLDFIGQDMSYFCKNIRQIHAGITRGGKEESTTFYLPKALVEAFNPLITYVCICSQIKYDTHSDLDLLKRYAKKVHKSLRVGKLQLISMIRTGDFSEAKVFRRVSAQDIVTMVTGRLVGIPSENPNGLPGHDGFNLLQIYRRYISRLELQVRTDPNAETFDAIQRLREELNIVNVVLDQQLKVLDKTKIVWINLKHSSQQISLQSIHQSRKMIKQMKRDLDELEDMAGKTSMLLRSMIEVRKESNSSAITIFTIVTVVFLPLSFITSYLGMNSVDIRNGTFHQSLFWVIALPSAAFLVFVLWVVIRFRHRMRRLWPRRRLLGSLRRIAIWLYGAMPGAEAPQASTDQIYRDVTLM